METAAVDQAATSEEKTREVESKKVRRDLRSGRVRSTFAWAERRDQRNRWQRRVDDRSCAE